MGILDSLSSTLGQGVNATERAARVVKLKGKVASLQKDREEAAASLGKVIYQDLCDDKSFVSKYDSYFERIRAIDADAHSAQSEIAQLESQQTASHENVAVRCRNCGNAVADNSAFCSHCGKPIEHKTPESDNEDASSSTCSKCGAPLQDGFAFCIQCGTPVNVSEDLSGDANVHGGELPNRTSEEADPQS